MALLHVLRHGESQANVEHVFSNGLVDLPLTALGERQAEAAARRLAGRPVAATYSSPLLRARQTAGVIARRLGTAVTVLDDLDEVRVGSLDGRREPEAWAVYEVVMERWGRGEADARFPDGESFGEAMARVRRALDLLAGRHGGGEEVVAVVHGGIMMTVVPRLVEMPAGVELLLPNCAISTLRCTPASAVCESWGAVDHLAGVV
jgi:broad specificity phosphatase PhoE